MRKKESIIRIRVVGLFFILFAGLLITKLYFVQIVHGENFSERADRQYIRSSEDIYDRGVIYFRDKDGTPFGAATLKSGFLVSINPTILTNPEQAYEKINSVISVDKETFLYRATKKTDPYEEIANRIDEEKALAIEDLNIDGVSVYREKWRYYPGDTLASHVLGLTGYLDNELAGRYGVERHYEETLKRDDSNLYVNFFAQVFAGINNSITHGEGDKTGDVHLTIEPTVELELERKLREIQETWSSKLTAGIVVDPKSGEIIAMAAYPDFNPNNREEIESVSRFSNPLVENVYEMGSIMKPLTIAAGLDAGVITPKTTYFDPGSLQVDDRTISNFDGESRGTVSMQEVLNQSLNTGVAFTVSKLGNKRFADYFRDYGLGERTEIDLPNEARGLINNLTSPRTVEYVTASFGQGIATTPISTVRALSALANGGILVTPHVTDRIDYEIGFSKDIKPEKGIRVLKKETSEEISRMLVKVVDEALAHGTVSLPQHSIAAKTGTAQIPAPDGAYYEDRFLHSFFGYFPAYEPEFLIFLLNVEPQGVSYASQTLTDPFMELTKFLINYYEIPADR